VIQNISQQKPPNFMATNLHSWSWFKGPPLKQKKKNTNKKVAERSKLGPWTKISSSQ
jgi:hypothetical protein